LNNNSKNKYTFLLKKLASKALYFYFKPASQFFNYNKLKIYHEEYFQLILQFSLLLHFILD